MFDKPTVDFRDSNRRAKEADCHEQAILILKVACTHFEPPSPHETKNKNSFAREMLNDQSIRIFSGKGIRRDACELHGSELLQGKSYLLRFLQEGAIDSSLQGHDRRPY